MVGDYYTPALQSIQKEISLKRYGEVNPKENNRMVTKPNEKIGLKKTIK